MSQSRLFKIATWNLDHPKPNSWKKTPALIDQIQTINADVWILTETNNLAIDLSSFGYAKFSSTEYEDKGLQHNAYTTIWSKIQTPTQAIKTFDSDISICIKLSLKDLNFLIYGTIITWHGDRGKDGKSRNWEEHYRSIEQHGNDWEQIMKMNPNCKLIIAGDFNQARDGSGWYGTRKGIDSLTRQLNRNNLICVTDQVKPQKRHNIDHICISQELQSNYNADVWENISDNDVIMSDHNGVFVDLKIASTQ